MKKLITKHMPRADIQIGLLSKFSILLRTISMPVVFVLQVIKLTLNFIAIGVSSLSTDYIYLNDGSSAASPIITILFSVYKSPLPYFVSYQRYMFIEFVSDNTTVYKGFNMSWTSTPKDYGKLIQEAE